MKIDIDKLTEPELADLNRRVVERLRFLQQARAHSAMLEFSVGDKVSFEPDGGKAVFGIITRYNKKTVTVISEDCMKWTVSPQLLRKLKDVPVNFKADGENVFPIKGKKPPKR